ncbi:MAG: HlyD family efflux transporter periplasmic adaptor subunit [Ruminococcaceae bacterium]|nr:HlyD family efflux transporter periplasmic adaptor subunit [Oscillospiraceae bacterium]
MSEQTVKHRGWVKNAAIIFLSIMLVLTFFSNTILNYSLPEVAAQYAQSGTITTKVRASAPIEANMTFNVEMADTRKIESVKVKVGDLVEAGDILLYLADEESQELKAAQLELASLELAYEKALLQLEDPSYAADNQQIKELKEDIAAKKAQRSTVANKAAAVDTAKAAVRSAEDAVDALSEQKSDLEEQITALSGDSPILSQYKQALSDAQAQLKSAEETLSSLKSQGGSIDSAQSAYDSARQALENLQYDLRYLEEDRALAVSNLEIAFADADLALQAFITAGDMESEAYLQALTAFNNAKAALDLSSNPAIIALDRNIEQKNLAIQRAQEDLAKAEGDLYTAQNLASQVSQAQSAVDSLRQQVTYAQQNYDSILSQTTSSFKAQLDNVSQQLKAANRNLEDANEALSKAQSESTTTVEAIDEEIKSMQRQLESLYIALGEKADNAEVSSAIANLDLQAQRKAIDDKKAEIEKLSAEGTGATVNAQYAGMISSIGCVAGDTVSTGSIVAVIEVVEKGYRMEFSVPNDQARLIKVGDKAEINDWWFSEADITVSNIRNDPKNPGQAKVITCTIAGDVTVGQTLNIVLGERGASYDIIVPNSAIREDSNGKFILVVEARSTPLSTRYIATRCDVTVVASDDNSSAVSGALYGNEFVITTSTKPIVAGQQVRLIEN